MTDFNEYKATVTLFDSKIHFGEPPHPHPTRKLIENHN